LSNNSNLLLQFFSVNNELEELKKFLDITYQEEQKNHISLLKNFQENSRQEVSDIFDTTNALQIIKEKFEVLSPLSSAAPVFSNINETIGKIGEGLEESWRLLEDSQAVFAGYAGQNQKEISDE
jgi:cysteinyl-tRNA synthetase